MAPDLHGGGCVLGVVVAALVALAVAPPRDTAGRMEPRGAAWVAVQPAGAARELLAQGVIDGQVSVDVVAALEGVVKSAAVEAGDTVDKGAGAAGADHLDASVAST